MYLCRFAGGEYRRSVGLLTNIQALSSDMYLGWPSLNTLHSELQHNGPFSVTCAFHTVHPFLKCFARCSESISQMHTTVTKKSQSHLHRRYCSTWRSSEKYPSRVMARLRTREHQREDQYGRVTDHPSKWESDFSLGVRVGPGAGLPRLPALYPAQKRWRLSELSEPRNCLEQVDTVSMWRSNYASLDASSDKVLDV